MYVVCGASGNIGKVITERLLEAGKQVRVVGRDENKLYPFYDRFGQNCELLVGDLDDTEWLTRVFEGAEAVYVLLPTSIRVENLRQHQGEMGQAIVTAIRNSGVKRVVNLSSVGAHLTRKSGPILGLHDQEERLNELQDVNILHLRPTYFMENLLGNIPTIKGFGANGAPISGERSIPMIATRDIGEYAARRLLALDFTGHTTQELLGPRDYSMNEATSILGQAIGNPELPYVQFPGDQAQQAMMGAGISADAARSFVEMYEGFDTGWIRPQEPRTAANSTPTTLEDFATQVFAPVFNHWQM